MSCDILGQMQNIIWEGDTPHEHYQVVDTLYDGRPARVLYSGNQQAAQSGIAQDTNPDLLFDYNQRFLELASGLKPERVLVIGGGAFTLPQALLHALPNTSIDAVELDAKLVELSRRYFHLPDSSRLHIYTSDGRTFLREYHVQYDMVIIDAFMHTTIPRELKTLQAFLAYREHVVEEQGVVAMNVISGYHGVRSSTLRQVYAAAQQTFDTVDVMLASYGNSLWLPQNFVLVGQRGQKLPVGDYMRYEAVSPLTVSPDIALRD